MPDQVFSGARDPFILGCFFGIFFLVIIYNFLFFLSLRNKSYLVHAVFSLSLAGMLFTLEGLTYTYLLPEGASFANDFISNIFEIFLYITGIQFGRYILSLKKHAPVVDKIFQGAMWASVLTFIASTISLIITGSNQLNQTMGSLFSICMAVILIVVGISLIKRRHIPLLYYLIGWLLLIFFIFLQMAREAGHVGDNLFTQYAFYFGAFFEVMCFSIALTIHVNKLKIEKEQERQKLLQADKLVTLGTMASSMAHEIANPNNVISSNVEFLSVYYNHLLPALDEFFHNRENPAVGALPFQVVRAKMLEGIDGIRKSSERIVSIISQLRDFYGKSRSEDFTNIEINRMIISALLFVEYESKNASVAVAVKFEPGTIVIKVNSHQIEQIIINLLLNSIAAIREKREIKSGPRAKRLHSEQSTITVSTHLNKEKDLVEIIIRDYGIGMDEDTLKRISEPFFSTKIDKGGSGLGLYVSKKIIHDHKGSLTFTSEAGAGTAAIIGLPVERRS
jgi:signal transduction histidine kinase